MCGVFGSCTIEEGGVFTANLKKMSWNKFSLTKTRRPEVVGFRFDRLLFQSSTWKEWQGLGLTYDGGLILYLIRVTLVFIWQNWSFMKDECLGLYSVY